MKRRDDRSASPYKGEECLLHLLPQIENHVAGNYGEVCGFIYPGRYVPLVNIESRNDRYYADPQVIAQALSRFGEPASIFHSHPNGCLELSAEDSRLWYYVNSTMMIGCMSGGRLRWKIYGNRSD